MCKLVTHSCKCHRTCFAAFSFIFVHPIVGLPKTPIVTSIILFPVFVTTSGLLVQQTWKVLSCKEACAFWISLGYIFVSRVEECIFNNQAYCNIPQDLSHLLTAERLPLFICFLETEVFYSQLS